jgi:hypothetical protein
VSAAIDIAGRVRRILEARELTLYQVSRRSAHIFGRRSAYFVPEHFYSGLARATLNPSLPQSIALSRISGYRLSDWLAVLGFSLDDIPRLQLRLDRRRTVLIDATVYDENQWVPWFAARTGPAALTAIAPLAQSLRPAPPIRVRLLFALNTQRFLYAKIGREDFFAFPDLAPGSIARIDPLRATHTGSVLTEAPSLDVFAIETGSGLSCGRLRRIGGNRVALCSTSFSGPPVELTLGRSARIIGVVDAEIRPVATARPSFAGTGKRARPGNSVRPLGHPGSKLGQLIRTSRIRAGLSFREASALSRSIAAELGDRNYFMSSGTLSDYDRVSTPPRQIQKILSLSILYGIGFWDFLRAGDFVLDSIGSDPMPDELCGRTPPRDVSSLAEEHPEGTQGYEASVDALSALIGSWKEIPLFLRSSLPGIAGLPRLSLFDFFSVGPGQDPTDSRLASAALVTVNRRLKKPVNLPPPAPREQPVYMMAKRDGGYVCASCRVDRGTLALYRQPLKPLAPVVTESRDDLEIIGQVTAILRRLP